MPINKIMNKTSKNICKVTYEVYNRCMIETCKEKQLKNTKVQVHYLLPFT